MISIGYLIGTALTVLVVLACILAFVFADIVDDDAPFFRVVATVVALIVFGIYAWAAFPFWNLDYHVFRSVSGTVEAIDVRALSDGKAATQNYAVRLVGGDTYRCDDTRCALVKPGDHISLSCMKEWQYAATPGYVCRFVANVPKAVDQ